MVIYIYYIYQYIYKIYMKNYKILLFLLLFYNFKIQINKIIMYIHI